MILVDIHAHLDHPDFEKDLDEVIDRARKAGVKAIISQGVSHEVNLKVLEIAKKYDIVKAALGLYPLDALNVKSETIEASDVYKRETKFGVDETLKFIKSKKDEITAIGEVGMDFKFSRDAVNQKENFQRIIELSESIKKPLIIHSRKAEREVVDMLESSNVKNAVLHVFSGNKKLVQRAADLGLSFSIPPIIVKLQHFQLMAEMVDLSQLLTETDAPWLSPYPGKRNEPAFVLETIKKIAEIKGLNAEETANNIFMNYQRLFE